ncbi:hypothetical protein EON73_01320 [bacterium]|nr:MAG: hypothetical protein EON73_01320 [bacterium]
MLSKEAFIYTPLLYLQKHILTKTETTRYPKTVFASAVTSPLYTQQIKIKRVHLYLSLLSIKKGRDINKPFFKIDKNRLESPLTRLDLI